MKYQTHSSELFEKVCSNFFPCRIPVISRSNQRDSLVWHICNSSTESYFHKCIATFFNLSSDVSLALFKEAQKVFVFKNCVKHLRNGNNQQTITFILTQLQTPLTSNINSISDTSRNDAENFDDFSENLKYLLLQQQPFLAKMCNKTFCLIQLNKLGTFSKGIQCIYMIRKEQKEKRFRQYKIVVLLCVCVLYFPFLILNFCNSIVAVPKEEPRLTSSLVSKYFNPSRFRDELQRGG